MTSSTPYVRCAGLRTIPRKKLDELVSDQVKKCFESEKKVKCIQNQICDECKILAQSWDLYYQSNIPPLYWNLEMEQFEGDKSLVKKYQEIVLDLKQTYSKGLSICLAGKNGVGKTTVLINILKRAVEKGYTCLYVTLNDIVAVMTKAPNDVQFQGRKEFLTVDFLVIDEFDPRFMPTDNASALFGRVLEDIFRGRTQSALPTLMCTNSPNVLESFPKDSPLRISIDSLMSNVKMIPVFGDDYRKRIKRV
jgi:DNA replication protein DnaC